MYFFIHSGRLCNAVQRFRCVASTARSPSNATRRSAVAGRGTLIAASALAFGTYIFTSDANNGAARGRSNYSNASFSARSVLDQEAPTSVDLLAGSQAPQNLGTTAAGSKEKTASPWETISDKVAKSVVPDWAKTIPDFIDKLQRELAMAPGTLGDEMWQEANDPEVNPEIMWDAKVRISNDLCKEEKNFLAKRKLHTTKSLAKYLNVPEEDVHPDDVPTIAMCGSGGGLRALVAGTSSYQAAQKAGLFDCVTYTAGVSGSCWLQTLYFSSMTEQRPDGILKHLKNRLGVHIAYPPPLLRLVTSAPTNKFLLSGGFEKYRVSKESDFGLVDLYGLLLGARLLVPKGELAIDYRDLKISNQRRYVDEGHHPLPIYTSVRHEIPITVEDDLSNEEVRKKVKEKAWFQWFEQTPYELWCEEFEAGIPSWATGHKFSGGQTVLRENGLAFPEIRIPFFMGIWGSAFCATLSHYYQEVRPLIKTIAAFNGLDDLVTERDDDLIKIHPVNPGQIPNFLRNMRDKLPASTPESIHTAEHIELMDAGMSNNLPIYPLLRPGRNVDIVIVFDASADVKKDNWLRVADGYARQRKIKGWPLGLGWPATADDVEAAKAELDAADTATQTEAQAKYEKAQRENPKGTKGTAKSRELGFCNVWVGTTTERTYTEEPPPPTEPMAESKSATEGGAALLSDSSEDWRLMEPDAGIAVVYFPFLPNPSKVEGVNPMTSDFMSTWNFIYTPEQVDKVAQLAQANFGEGDEIMRRTVRAVWERKRKQRLDHLKARKYEREQALARQGIANRSGSGHHGDLFS